MSNNRWFQVSGGNPDITTATNDVRGNSVNGSTGAVDWCQMINSVSCQRFKDNLPFMQDGSAPPLATAQGNSVINLMINAFITNAAMINQTITPQTAYDHLKRCCLDTNTGTGSEIPCKYVQSHGVCQSYMGYINAGDVASAMQQVNAFALSEGISSPAAYALVLRCCGDNNTGEIPCEDFWPNIQQQQGWCQKWQQAQGNPTAIQAEINNLSTVFGITTAQAQSVFTRCCPGTGDRPCPPTDQNSPFWTNPNEFCPQCVPGGGYAGHPDCRCCDDCPPTDQYSPFYTNPTFCDSDWCNPTHNHIDCKCCPSTVDVSPWCPQYVIAVDNADLSAMQSIITAVSSNFNLTWAQASQLLYDECLCPNGNTIVTVPCNLTGELCADYQNFLAGTSPFSSLQPLLQHWVNMFAMPQMGGYILTETQLQDIITRCCNPTGAGPCDNYPGDNGCCGKCDNTITPGHQCYNWCQQWKQCCPGNNNTTGTGTGTPPTQGTSQSRLAGGENNPIGMGSLTDGKLSFTGGYMNTHQWKDGGFLTDPPGDEQSLEEFYDELL